MRLIRYISFILFALSIQNSYSQWTGVAYEFYKNQDYDNAKEAIDSAINTTERFDSQTWQLRGLIYRSIADGDQQYYREIAMESFIRAKEADTAQVYTAKINDYLKNTILRYYNDAVQKLKTDKDFEGAENAYVTYKKHYKTLLDPLYDFTQSDIEFYNALGAELLKKSEDAELSKKEPFRNKSVMYCSRVLELDSMNFQSNFNIGIIYYTLGVEFITTIDPEISIEELILNQKRAEESFLKAVPYLLRCETVQPDNLDVKIGLMGCYYGLNNESEYIKYQTFVDIVMLPQYLKTYQNTPTDIENLKTLIRIYKTTLPNEAEAEKYEKELNSLLDQ